MSSERSGQLPGHSRHRSIEHTQLPARGSFQISFCALKQL